MLSALFFTLQYPFTFYIISLYPPSTQRLSCHFSTTKCSFFLRFLFFLLLFLLLGSFFLSSYQLNTSILKRLFDFSFRCISHWRILLLFSFYLSPALLLASQLHNAKYKVTILPAFDLVSSIWEVYSISYHFFLKAQGSMHQFLLGKEKFLNEFISFFQTGLNSLSSAIYEFDRTFRGFFLFLFLFLFFSFFFLSFFPSLVSLTLTLAPSRSSCMSSCYLVTMAGPCVAFFLQVKCLGWKQNISTSLFFF